ncbi:MAG: tRNA (5-methylaminomethyl-2-thiouridine)(34)-methyltransferase MnmD [Flavobacteriales bacterium]
MDANKKMPDIILTGDGSHSLYNEELNETYHSRHGALRESRYVFIDQGLALVDPFTDPIRILEVGFGTGMNAVLTANFASEHHRHIQFSTLETLPLDTSITDQINVAKTIGENNSELFKALHAAPWEQLTSIEPYFSIHKRETSLQNAELEAAYYDIIFYDAFGPQAQPEMWTRELFEKLYASLKPEGIFVTYCAKGQVRRDLQDIGFSMTRLPGPPGKREMLRGLKAEV